MSFTLQLSQDLVEVEAGATVPVTFVVSVRGEASDQFEVEVQGIDGEWTAVPVPTFKVEPEETHSERFFLKPPRTSESLAGNYPFVLRVRSLDSGEQKTAQGVLKLKPFHHLSSEIDPKRGVFSPIQKRNTFTFSCMNLGNTEHSIQLVANDPEDRLTFEFENEQITIGPGQQKDVEVTATPTTSRLISSGRLIGFSVTARSTTTPSIVTSSQAQLEQRSLITATWMVITFVIALLVFAWISLMPKNPGVSLMVSPSRVMVGDAVHISWQGHDATRIVIHASGGETIYEGPDLSGTRDYIAKVDGTVIVEAIASREGNNGPITTQQFTVAQLEQSPLPTLNEFKASASKVKVGGSVTFTWAVDGATKVAITPVKDDLAPDLLSVQIDNITQPQDYQLVAFNKDGKSVRSKTIHIDTFEESDAAIITFESDPKEVREEEGGHVSLSWEVTNAALVKLQVDNGPAEKVELNDKRDLTISAKTTVTLLAYDTKGRASTRKLTIDFKKATLPAPDEASGPTIEPNGPSSSSGPKGTGN